MAVDESWLGMLFDIMELEGSLALWKGTTPNMIRNVILNIVEMVTFDEVYTRLSGIETFGPGLISLILASSVRIF
jgi:Mitochondrial carrier protein